MRSIEEIKPVVEFVLIVLVVGFSVMARRAGKGGDERPEPSAAKFLLYLVAALACGGMTGYCVQYVRNHPGDYADYLMLVGALVGAPFALGFLLGALIEGLRVVFRR